VVVSGRPRSSLIMTVLSRARELAPAFATARAHVQCTTP